MIRATIVCLSLTVLAAAAAAVEIERTVTVDGRGHVMVRPDMARVTLAVEERNKSLSTAQEAVADVTADVLSLLDDLDVEDRHINSTGATVQPNYRWNNTLERQELVGYIARRRIDVEVRDLDILGKLIERSVRVGVNQVSPPALDSSRRREAYREALAKAAEDARRNAAVLADTLDMDLGDVVQINAGGYSPPPMPIMRGGMAAARMAESDAGAATYNPGEMRLEANVNAVFELDD
ncbi:MAG: SIMPL domain-containing protein [Gammaproteobacteria bacterium]